MTNPCTCMQAYAGLFRPPCQTHGTNWVSPTPPRPYIEDPARPGISAQPIVLDEGPLNDFNKGYRAGIEAAMKLMSAFK